VTVPKLLASPPPPPPPPPLDFIVTNPNPKEVYPESRNPPLLVVDDFAVYSPTQDITNPNLPCPQHQLLLPFACCCFISTTALLRDCRNASRQAKGCLAAFLAPHNRQPRRPQRDDDWRSEANQRLRSSDGKIQQSFFILSFQRILLRLFLHSFDRSFHSKRSCASFFIHPSHHSFIPKDDPPAPLSSSIRLFILSFQRILLCLFLLYIRSFQKIPCFIHSFIPSIFHSKGSSASFFIHSVIYSFIPKDPVPPLSSFIHSFFHS